MFGFLMQTGKAFTAAICKYRDGGGLQREEIFTNPNDAMKFFRRFNVLRVIDYTHPAIHLRAPAVNPAQSTDRKEIEMNNQNAALIAAAPDLLAALDKILRAHESGNNGAVMGEAILCESFAMQARAAIAKANTESAD